MITDNKVTCRYCGHEMQPDEKTCVSVYAEGHWKSQQPVNYRCECGAESPIADGMVAAYIAANKRPENKPLSREQIMEMDRGDAVWVYRSEALQWVHSAHYVRQFLLIGGADVVMYFAAKPTPEDIEAAKKAAALKEAALNDIQS